MGAPLLVTATLARSRFGRRLATTFFAVLAMVALFALAPLAVIPIAVSGFALPTGETGNVDPATPAANGEWSYPLAGEYHKGRGFGHNPVHGCSYCSTNHKGYDMAQGCGSTIYAAGPGTVIVAGPHHGWGNTVRIDHGNGLETLYGHMQWGSIRVAVGEELAAGIPLGSEGNTGRSHGCHLHFEVRENGTAINPEPFMAALGLPLK